MSDKKRVIIVDDHDLFRMTLRIAIETRHPDLDVVGDAKYGADLFAMLRTVEADIVLLDIVMPGMSGTEVARRLKNEHPEMKILAVSSEDSMDKVQEMVDIGIEGFISKSQGNIDDIAVAVRTVVEGYSYFGRDIADIIHRIYLAKKKTLKVTSEFTEQETRIIHLCHEGLSAKEVANRLNISARTVEWHKKKIFEKLNINTTAEMLNYAVENGIIRPN